MSDQASIGDQLIAELNEMRRRIGGPETCLRQASEPSGHWATEHELLLEESDKGTRVENQLAQSESLCRTLLGTAKNVIWTVDLNLQYTYVSPSVTQVFGYPVEEIMAMHPLDGLTPESRERLINAFRKELALEASGSREKYMSRTDEIERYHKDGSICCEQITTTFLRDTHGKPIGILGISDDVTERKRMEDELREARDGLERRVEERTEELMRANAQLREAARERNEAEEVLRLREQRLELALQGAGLGLWDWYVQTDRAVVNKRFAEIVGYELDEIETHFSFWESLLHPEDRLRAVENIYAHLEGRTDHYEDDYRVKAKSGDWKWISARGKIVERDRVGKPLRMAGTYMDITDRKRAEESLRNMLYFRQTLIDSIPNPVFYKDSKGRYIGCNESFAALVGLPKEEVVGKSVYEVVAKEVADIWQENDLDLFRNPRVHVFEFTMPHPDGTERTFLNHKAPFFDPDGILAGLIGVMVDVTVQKGSEQALRVSEERMRLLIESSPVGICIVQDGKYAYVNPALTKIMGCEGPDEILGESPLTFIAPEDRDLVQRIGKQGLEGLETDQNYQVAGLKKSGELFQVTIWPSRMDYLGKPSLLFFVADITPQKMLERQLVLAQKMEAIGILAAGIAHDFNNLLTIVQGYSELLLSDQKVDDPYYGDLQKIAEASHRGAKLVRNLLSFCRKVENDPRPMNLNDEVVAIEKLLNRTIPKMIQIEVHLDGGLAAINADPGQIGQVLMNLAVNAQHAMPDGGKLTLATSNLSLDEAYCKSHPAAQPGEYVMLTVSDTGRGMDREILGHIFQPFFTTKGPDKGTGLGLAVVYGIVQQYGGHITCESEPGHGTTVKIYLPAIHDVEPERGSRAPKTSTRSGTETILLVDDEEYIRDFGEKLLTRAGYMVLTADSGPKAVELYAREGDRIALIILDLVMPEMGGEACLEEILAINAHAKILISTGGAVEGKKKETIESGASGFISKPYHMGQMLAAVREALDRT